MESFNDQKKMLLKYFLFDSFEYISFSWNESELRINRWYDNKDSVLSEDVEIM